jgi:archaellin
LTDNWYIVTWAQRSSSTTPSKNIIYLTIVAPDVPPNKAKIDLKPTYVEFTGESATKKTTYHVKLEFYSEIDVEESKSHHSARDIAFVLRKKENKDEYWPRLVKSSQKLHFLKTDFDKWVDEDEQNAVEEEDLSNLGGMGADGGFGGIGML